MFTIATSVGPAIHIPFEPTPTNFGGTDHMFWYTTMFWFGGGQRHSKLQFP